MGDEQDKWLQVLGIPAIKFAKDPADDVAAPTKDPEQEERDRRDQQQQQAGQPVGGRLADATREVLMKYAADNLGAVRDEALAELARAWRESPGGVIAAGTILGAAGVAYLVGTRSNIPSIPAIPLDFLAGRAPAFRGAELNISVDGPITGPQGIHVSITFHEQGPTPQRSRPGRGHAFTTRMTLRQQGVSAADAESGSELLIEGEVPMPSDAKAEDAAATRAAIEDGTVEVEVGGSPAMRVDVLGVEDNYHPGQYGLSPPPTIRHLTVRLRTTIPPMFHQGPDEIAERGLTVRINRVSSEGEAKIRVHLQPLPTPGGEAAPQK